MILKTLRIWKIQSNWNCILKAKEHQAKLNKEKRFAQLYLYHFQTILPNFMKDD